MKHVLNRSPLIDITFNKSYILEFATEYRAGMLGLVDEGGKFLATEEERGKQKNDPVFHYLLCQSLADYIGFLNLPVYKLQIGYLRKENDLEDHIWIVLGDKDRSILDPMARHYNEASRKMPVVYFGKKPEWYEEVEEENHEKPKVIGSIPEETSYIP